MNISIHRRVRTLMLALAVAAVMILLTGQFARRGILSGLEWRSVDLRFRFRGPIPPEPEILIIGVDETTFRELGLKYPFPPVIYAELLDRLGNAGAAAVLFDFLYSEPTRECDPPNQDALLAEAIERNGAVVWAVELEAGKHPVEPIPVIRDAVQGLGFINLPDERDSRIRRFLPEKGGFKAFAVAGVEAYAGFVPEDWRGERFRLINYRGGTGTYPAVSLSRVLGGHVPDGELAGRICLVGATFAASHDVYPTPFHRIDEPDMPGVEIHANILGNLLRGDRLVLHDSSLFWVTLFALCVAISAVIAFERAWWALGLWIAASGGWAVWAMERFLAGIVVPLVLPLAALAATFWVSAFTGFIMQREQRKRVRDLFSSYVDPSIVNWLLRHPDSVRPEGERRQVTVLDTDIEGFTAITHNMAPEALVSQLNEYFEVVTKAALDAGGMHDKYVGDALMVIYGFPLEQPDHALRAVMASKAILESVDRLNRRWEREGRPVFNTRVGICSGEVVMGNIGGTKRKAFTAMGDAANMASRLEGMNKRFGTRILLSDTTQELLPGDIPLKDLGEVQIRGVEKPVRVFNPAFDLPPEIRGGSDGPAADHRVE